VATVPDVTAPVPPRAAFTARFDGGRIGRGPAIIAALGLLVVGAAATAKLWDDNRHTASLAALPAAESAAASSDAAGPAKPLPETDSAAAPVAADPQETASAQPDPVPPPPEAAEESPPEEVSTADAEEGVDDGPAAVSEAPSEGASGLAGLAARTAADDRGADDVALADPSSPPVAADDFDAPPDEMAGLEEDAPPPTDVRLPRQRPQPPAASSRQPSVATQAPAAAAAAPAHTASVAPPRQRGAPPRPLGELTVRSPDPSPAAPPPRTTYYGPGGEPVAETLTPEEYASLLRRRGLAEDLAARRRAGAEEPVPYYDRPMFRLLRRD
jgi:hypothetical protein